MALWGNKNAESNKPKYLSPADKALVSLVTIDAVSEEENIEKGMTTPGWVKYTTYTDSNGNTRNKPEVLVAFSVTDSDSATAPILVEAPEITGTFKVGETVTVDQGVWDSYTAPTFNYQWLLDGVGIVGATFNTYTIEAGDATKELSVKVFVGNPIGTTEFISTPVVVEA